MYNTGIHICLRAQLVMGRESHSPTPSLRILRTALALPPYGRRESQSGCQDSTLERFHLDQNGWACWSLVAMHRFPRSSQKCCAISCRSPQPFGLGAMPPTLDHSLAICAHAAAEAGTARSATGEGHTHFACQGDRASNCLNSCVSSSGSVTTRFLLGSYRHSTKPESGKSLRSGWPWKP